VVIGVYLFLSLATPTAFIDDSAISCARGGLVRGKIVCMKTELYPRISFRLSQTMKARIARLALQRHISTGRIVRDALTNYFSGSERIDEIF